eukprot:3828651-Rhodomonas_salina.1
MAPALPARIIICGCIDACRCVRGSEEEREKQREREREREGDEGGRAGEEEREGAREEEGKEGNIVASTGIIYPARSKAARM